MVPPVLASCVEFISETFIKQQLLIKWIVFFIDIWHLMLLISTNVFVKSNSTQAAVNLSITSFYLCITIPSVVFIQ